MSEGVVLKNPYLKTQICLPISSQSYISLPPKRLRKPKDFLTFSGGVKMKNSGKILRKMLLNVSYAI